MRKITAHKYMDKEKEFRKLALQRQISQRRRKQSGRAKNVLLMMAIWLVMTGNLTGCMKQGAGTGATTETPATSERNTVEIITTEPTATAPTTTEPTTMAPTTTEPTTAETTTMEEETTTQVEDIHVTAEKYAAKLLAEMTLEEKVGQMFIARCPAGNAAAKAAEYKLGGYILFGRDFKDRTYEQAMQYIAELQSEVKLPMLIGVDEEGGTVNRVSRYSQYRATPFKAPQELYTAGGFEAVAADAKDKSEFLLSLGINLNFAPVCDVSTNETDFIYNRSFGKDATMTAEYIEKVVLAMSDSGMGSVLKHFPGYGNNADTHTGMAYDERPYENFVQSDFLPFRAGIEAGADVVMVSHNIVVSMDTEYPASLSSKVHEILRNELGFNGVIVTDELSMEGITDFADASNAAVLAVKAGNDLLCCTNFEEQVPAVIAAVQTGEISEEQINESVYRILLMKISLGIINIDM